MKKIKVLALCAVLVGLGGAMTAKPSAKYDQYKDIAVAGMRKMNPTLTELSDDEIWDMLDDEVIEAVLASSGSGSGSGSDSGSKDEPVNLPPLKSLDTLKDNNSYTQLVAPESQSGLVSEVDDYMDVNSWQGVEFDKLFTHVGYNINNQFNAGLATRIGKVYVGGFFYGNFIDSTTETSKWKEGSKKGKTTATTTTGTGTSNGSGSGLPGTDDDDDNNSSTGGSSTGPSIGGDYDSPWGDYGYDSYALDDLEGIGDLLGGILGGAGGNGSANSGQQVFQLSGLIGIGNLGIKPSVLFSPKAGNGSSKYTFDGDTSKTTNSHYEIYPQVEVGYNLSIASLVLTPHAHIGFDFDVDKDTFKDSDGDKRVTGSTTTWTVLGFGTGLELPKKDGSIVTNSFSADLDLAFRSAVTGYYYDNVDKGNKTEKDKSGVTHGLFTLGWTGKFVPTDNVSFKLASTLPIEWMVVKYSDQTWNRNSATDIAPTLKASVKYQASEKLALGLSADLGLPAIEIQSAGAGDNKDSKVRFNTEDRLELLFGAGFRFDFTQNVTLDCGWNFGGNLFNNYFKDVSDHGYTFWSGLSYIFSDIQLGLSVKL